ncbi:MAG: hypothetical protein LKE61_08455 [Erysipelotrichaceae bacterium]|jgi:DNA-binding MurR/RpiR family transcriptional regulator|nr:hypothetical protein [Erysipelotrichaceae bacterium]MCI1326556.1 hypothetical protein [Solobacterium sp.]MCH4044115.1 hypothetical protein [Erysipelotrichaceae bacterium]MCH4121330.1 hypothetical protein [Erysipelotrichaceae bacterium]MCI1363333.1 hypothetical protein [Solobacterium sp.]
MNTLLSLLILIAQNSLDQDLNYAIASYIIQHFSSFGKMTLQKFCDDCGVSTSSVMKFCRMLGFSSFTQFKDRLYSAEEIRCLQLEQRMKNCSVQNLWDKIDMLGNNPAEIVLMKQSMAVLAEWLKEEKRITLHGAVFPLALMQSAMEDLIILGYPANVVQYNRDTFLPAVSTGIQVVISYSGRFLEEKKDAYQKICAQNRHVVLISSVQDEHASLQVPMPDVDKTSQDMILLGLMDILIHGVFRLPAGFRN